MILSTPKRERLEKIHNYKCNTFIPPELVSLSSVQASLYIDLANRRRYADICFLSELVNRSISCPELLSSFDFHVPQYQ